MASVHTAVSSPQTHRSSLYAKDCQNHQKYLNELEGWNFIRKYYPDVPALHKTDAQHHLIVYENIGSKSNCLVNELLVHDTYKARSLRPTFAAMAAISKKYSAVMPAGGGTQAFYLNRRKRLQTREFIQAYQAFCDQTHQGNINGHPVNIQPGLPRQVLAAIRKTGYTRCVPSQGDLHEHNIFADGRMIDFEAAGWNALSTDIATFLWHTLFVGCYLGPKYTPRDIIIDSRLLANARQTFSVSSNRLTMRINRSRRNIAGDFIRSYVQQLDLTISEEKEILAAIAFRLLSMYNPATMPRADKMFVFSLANLCMQDGMRLQEFSNLLTGSKPVYLPEKLQSRQLVAAQNS